MSKAAELAALIGSQSSLSNRNFIINGNFDVWQRGVTIDPVSSSVYGVDRWANFYSSINAQQTFALGQTDVSGIVKYSSRWTAKTTSGTAPFTRIEDVTRLGGKSITVSFYAKASTEVTVDLRFAQRFGSSGSATNFDTITDALTITTSWQEFTYTRTLASIAGKTLGDGNNTEFAILATDLTTNDWIELSQVQLELGETATPFEHRSYADELARCQRYYAVVYTSNRATVDSGELGGHFTFKTTMRASPTMGDFDPGSPENITGLDQFYGTNTEGSGVSITTGGSGNRYVFGASATADAEL